MRLSVAQCLPLKRHAVLGDEETVAAVGFGHSNSIAAEIAAASSGVGAGEILSAVESVVIA